MKKEELFKDFRLWVGYLLSSCDSNELQAIYDNPSSIYDFFIYDMRYTFIVNYDNKYTSTFVSRHKAKLLEIVKETVKEYL